MNGGVWDPFWFSPLPEEPVFLLLSIKAVALKGSRTFPKAEMIPFPQLLPWDRKSKCRLKEVEPLGWLHWGPAVPSCQRSSWVEKPP